MILNILYFLSFLFSSLTHEIKLTAKWNCEKLFEILCFSFSWMDAISDSSENGTKKHFYFQKLFRTTIIIIIVIIIRAHDIPSVCLHENSSIFEFFCFAYSALFPVEFANKCKLFWFFSLSFYFISFRIIKTI